MFLPGTVPLFQEMETKCESENDLKLLLCVTTESSLPE